MDSAGDQGSVMRGAFAASAVGMAICDAGLVVVHVNGALESLLGQPADELTGRRLADLAAPDHRERARAAEDAVVRREADGLHEERRAVRGDGTTVWLDVIASPIRADGLVERYIVHAFDVTSRRQEEERRRYAEALSAQVIERAPTAMAVLGMDGRFVTVNRAMAELMEDDEDALTGRSFVEAMHPDAVEHAYAQRRRLLRGELDRYDEEVPCVTRSGAILWVLLSVSCLRGQSGQIHGFIVLAQDISIRRATEQALRDSERAALEASALKSQFLANMSHEIRTPMNGVLGMLDALDHSRLTDDQRRHVETARRSAEGLLTIIDDVLDFSKIEAGRLELETEPVDVTALLEDLRQLLWPRAQERGLRLMVQLAPGIETVVLGDPVRLRQVLVNLITNAIKFSERGEVVIAVDRTDDGQLGFAVSDEGVGIDPATLEQLFEPFTQADISTTRRFGGTGLGLPISRHLAELMGGSITATSTPGAGSTFLFTAPLPPAGTAGEPGPDVLEGVVALVAVDSDAGRAAAVALLDRWGVEVVAATLADAAQAHLLAAARGVAPTVALLVDPTGHATILPLLAQLRERAGGTLPALLVADAAQDEPLPVAVIALCSPVGAEDLHGALVELTGRVAPAAAEAVDPEAPVAERPMGVGRRVLVAEDNVVNQQVAMLSLERRGFAVDIAADGEEAVAAAGRTAYDLIFMDCQMPRMDGYAATVAIRQRQAEGGPATPIIAMTAASMDDDRERCRVAGMDDFVAKPVRAEDLDAVLRRWLPADEA